MPFALTQILFGFGSKWVRAAWAFAFVLCWPCLAQAYPWMLRHEYTTCMPCHSDPSGGGVLTEYGRAQGEVLLRTNYSGKTDEEPGKVKDFLFGLFKTPEELLLGGSFRGMGIATRVSSAQTQPDPKFILMQADLRGQLTIGRFRANAAVGYLDEGARAAQVTHRKEHNIVSREHWFGVDLGEQAYLLRAGRINLPFGIRQVEHTLLTRKYTNTDINSSQQHGLSLAHSGEKYRFETMLIAGNFQLNPDRYRERGYSAYLEKFFSQACTGGISSKVTYAKKSISQDTNPINQAHGVFTRGVVTKKLVLLGEANFLLRTTKEDSTRFGGVGMLQADYEIKQGLHLIGTGEFGRDSQKSANPSAGGWLSINWFFLPHTDLRIDAVGTRVLASTKEEKITILNLLAQLHVYL